MTYAYSDARLLVLGAGLFQLAGITRAIELGCKVITLDNQPSNPGHRLAHESINLSTTDTSSVVRIAKNLGVDGVVTFASDIATVGVVAARSHLSLSGPEVESVKSLTTKSSFRERQRELNFPTPRFVIVTTAHSNKQVRSLADQVGWPAIVKPVDSSGSRGVSIVRTVTDLNDKVTHALRVSPSGTAVLEELIPGTEVGGDVFLRDGQIVGGCVTNKHLRDLQVVGHTLPSHLPPDTQTTVLKEVSVICSAFGVTDGAVNFDVMVDPSEKRAPVVLEVSPRTGGNGIPELIHLHTGFDEYAATIRQALGVGYEQPHDMVSVSCGSTVFGAKEAGVFKGLCEQSQLLDAPQSVHSFWLRNEVGQVVARHTDANSILGYMTFASEGELDYWQCVDVINERLNIVLDQEG